MFKVELSGLATMFLICKRVKGEAYYHRGPCCSQTTTMAHKAKLFKTKEDADKECTERNAKRKGKGYKFRVENAAKHYVNSWELQFNSWEKQLVIKNDLKSFENIKRFGFENVNTSLNDQKANIIQRIQQEIRNNKERVEKKIEELEKEKQYLNTTVTGLTNVIAMLDTTDLDEKYVKPNTTSMDRTAAVLFGKKEETKNPCNEIALNILTPLKALTGV